MTTRDLAEKVKRQTQEVEVIENGKEIEKLERQIQIRDRELAELREQCADMQSMNRQNEN